MKRTIQGLMFLAAIGLLAAPAFAERAAARKVCKKVQATCSAPACTVGAPLPSDPGCLCNNSCNCTGQIECYQGAVVVETQQCTGTCVRTMYTPDGEVPAEGGEWNTAFTDQDGCLIEDDETVAAVQPATVRPAAAQPKKR